MGSPRWVSVGAELAPRAGAGIYFLSEDRKSRYLILSLIQNKSAKETKQTLCSSLKDKPVLSI
ncbi:hypothetical protein, partial [Faecalispora jeddahensis]|uniref:hypothetical protein n=1 Tax=Faecalispora jeddahensis TaxID=1414721 RepID=UPI0019D4FA09